MNHSPYDSHNNSKNKCISISIKKDLFIYYLNITLTQTHLLVSSHKLKDFDDIRRIKSGNWFSLRLEVRRGDA